MFNFLFKKKKQDEHVRNSGGSQTSFTQFPWQKYLASLTETFGAASAKKIAAVYACRQAIVESLSMLPINVFRENDEFNSEKVKDHPVHNLLRYEPNEYMDGMQFHELVVGNMLDSGNFYALIEKKRSGAINRLIPLPSQATEPKFVDDGSGKRLIYKTTQDGEVRECEANEILHININSLDGIVGRSPLSVASDVYRLAKSINDHGINYFANRTFIDVVLETDSFFKEDKQRHDFKKRFDEWVSQTNNGTFLLEQGVRAKPLTMSNRDAQFVESVSLSTLQIAQVYRVPPIFIQVMDKALGFSSVEQLAIFLVQYTVQPWATRLERAYDRQLLRRFGHKGHFVRFNVEALLRGDLKTQTEAIALELKSGLMSINEGRALKNRKPIPGGDQFFIEANNLAPLPDPDNPDAPKTIDPIAAQDDEDKKKDAKSNKKFSDFQPLIRDVLHRLTTKESKAICTASKKPAFVKFAEEFYAKHRSLVRESMEPVALAIFGEEEMQAKGRDLFNAWLEEFIQKSQQSIMVALKQADSAVAISMETERWLDEINVTACDFWQTMNGGERETTSNL